MSGVWRVTVTPRCFDQAILYFSSRIVFVVKDTEFRVSPFAVQVKFAFLIFVEVHSPLD